LQFLHFCVMIPVDIILLKGRNNMKNRLLSVLLCICLILAAIPTVTASFTDIEGHWAQEYITTVTDGGLFTGTSETTFSPNMTMTRAMFVAVLGRFEGIDVEHWTQELFPDFHMIDVPDDAYYAPYVRWAVSNGIVNGIADSVFAPDAPVTREQMAKIIAFYVEKIGGVFSVDENAPENFSDVESISEWAISSVEALRTSGILNGSPNGDGSVSFLPSKTATRAEAAAVFCRIEQMVELPEPQPTEPDMSEEPTEPNTNEEPDSGEEPTEPDGPVTLSLNVYEMDLDVGQTYQLIATAEPTAPLTYTTSDSSILLVDENGLVTCVGEGQASITAHTPNGLSASCSFTCTLTDSPDSPDYPDADDTYTDKCMYVFGEYVDEHRYYYNDIDAALADMQEVTLTVWDIGSNGEKYTKTMSIKVHKNLAQTVIAIFDEIYHGEEQFPICYLGGWNWSGKSEHSIGTAIDINYPQNYYCDPDGNALVGDYWKPGEDPYSIKPDGDVVRAFEKYGFRWGVNWNSGYKDYMHFSFFGT